MSIRGQSFSGGTDGALVNFDVGNAADIFTGAFTVACLAKFASTNWGMLGGYSDSVGGTQQGGLFLANNSGGRLYSVGDFTNGFPDPGDVASPGLSDDTWRWLVVSKAAGSAHYRWHYADLATLTWVHGESVSAANHGDAGAVVVFSTWSLYAMGNDSGDMAALAGWGAALSDGAVESALTQAFADLQGGSPAIGWVFPEATAGSAVSDFTGGGGDEIHRQLITTSADPDDYDFTPGAIPATVHPATIAAVASLPASAEHTGSTVSPAAIAAVAAFPSATKSGGATIAPAVVAAVTTLPAGAVRTGSTVHPAAVATVAAFPATNLTTATNATVHPGAIAIVAALPAVTVQAAANATIHPAAIAAVAALPTAHVSSGGVVVYTRLGGALVSSSLRGTVRINGASVAFG